MWSFGMEHLRLRLLEKLLVSRMADTGNDQHLWVSQEIYCTFLCFGWATSIGRNYSVHGDRLACKEVWTVFLFGFASLEDVLLKAHRRSRYQCDKDCTEDSLAAWAKGSSGCYCGLARAKRILGWVMWIAAGFVAAAEAFVHNSLGRFPYSERYCMVTFGKA